MEAQNQPIIVSDPPEYTWVWIGKHRTSKELQDRARRALERLSRAGDKAILEASLFSQLSLKERLERLKLLPESHNSSPADREEISVHFGGENQDDEKLEAGGTPPVEPVANRENQNETYDENACIDDKSAAAFSWNPPVSEQDLDALLRSLPSHIQSLPEDLVALLSVHDGDDEGVDTAVGWGATLGDRRWLPAKAARELKKIWDSFLIDGTLEEPAADFPKEADFYRNWSRSWIPFSEDGAGNCFCVDAASPQFTLIFMDHETGGCVWNFEELSQLNQEDFQEDDRENKATPKSDLISVFERRAGALERREVLWHRGSFRKRASVEAEANSSWCAIL